MKKIKFVAALVAALAIAAFVLAGCSSGASSSAASSASGSDSSASASASASSGAAEEFTLVVGFDAGFPPYGYTDEAGNPIGFDLDLAKAVCDKMGWGFEAKPIDWKSKDLELESGNINCIWNGFTIEGRESEYQFTKPYMLNEQVIVVKADSGITSFADLAGKKVITQEGSAALDLLTKDDEHVGDHADLGATFAGGAPDTIADYESAFMQVESGAYDAVAVDLPVAEYIMNKMDAEYVILDEQLNSEHFGVGFKLGEVELAQSVSDVLLEMYQDGTVEQLCDKYQLAFDKWVLVD